MSHDLDVRRTGAGLTIAACACGDWRMKLGPDALVGPSSSLHEIVARAHVDHVNGSMAS